MHKDLCTKPDNEGKVYNFLLMDGSPLITSLFRYLAERGCDRLGKQVMRRYF